MRVTRAFVGSVGAGLCLVAAAVTALFVLSAVVAVRGWPGIDPENDVPRVTLADASAASPALDTAESAPAVVAASAPIVLGAPARSGGDGDAPRSGGRDPRRTGGGDTSAPGSATTPSGTSGSTSPSGPAQGSPSPPAAPGSPTGPVAETIRETGRDVAGAADPVAPGSSSAVTQVTDPVADTVDGTDTTVRDTGAVVEKTTDAVGGLLGRR